MALEEPALPMAGMDRERCPSHGCSPLSLRARGAGGVSGGQELGSAQFLDPDFRVLMETLC